MAVLFLIEKNGRKTKCLLSSLPLLCQQKSIVKATMFPVLVYRCENWTIKKAEC